MVDVDKIRWGKYGGYEGPYYPGQHGYKLPDNPTENEEILATITATEGGRWDAYNGYDKCISTSGLIQWCESGFYAVSDMLGKVAERDPSLISTIDNMAINSGLEFQKNARGRWRFFFKDDRGEVDRKKEQRQMFLLSSNGKQGTWDDDDNESKDYAKDWAAAISTVWENETAQRIQGEFTAQRFNWFLLPFAKKIFKQAPNNAIGKSFKAAYLSFAANNPTWANKHLQIGMKNTSHQTWTKDWLIAILKELTFGPKITIYPHRYDKIRPVIEKLYGIDLIDFADELKLWKDEMGGEGFMTDKEVQELLLKLGFDLGPAKADGIFGKKSRTALLSFQQMHGITETGFPDAQTREMLIAQQEASSLIPDDLRDKLDNLIALSTARLAREAMEEISRNR